VTLVRFSAQNHPQQVGTRGALDEVDDRGTDPALFAQLHERFGFTLDVAAAAHNAKCTAWFGIEDDALSRSWITPGAVWCNPPYSDLGGWLAKAWLEHRLHPHGTIVMLLPNNRCEQRWWQDHVEPHRDRPGSPLRVEFLPGRPRFVKPGNTSIGPNERPPFGCCLLIWRA
jgi:phage N-6-adenine-methyltransferase